MTQLTIELSEDARAELERLAAEAGTPAGQLVSSGITDVLQQLKDRRQIMDELKDADLSAIDGYLDLVPAGPVPDTDRRPEDGG